MKHVGTETFWKCYDALPPMVQKLANKNYLLLKADHHHPSLQFKPVRKDLWSVRVGLHVRALAIPTSDGFAWIWIGSHADYDKLIK